MATILDELCKTFESPSFIKNMQSVRAEFFAKHGEKINETNRFLGLNEMDLK